MKSCLVCTTQGHDDALATCPFCGEASWSETARQSEAEPRRAPRKRATTTPELTDPASAPTEPEPAPAPTNDPYAAGESGAPPPPPRKGLFR